MDMFEYGITSRQYLIVQLSKHHISLHIIEAKQGTSNQMSPWNICHWSWCCLEYLPCSQ